MFGSVRALPPARLAGRNRVVACVFGLVLALAWFLGQSGPASAAVFVDATLGDVKPEQKAAVAHPQPVQLLFQFRTKGSPNMQVTKTLKPQVLEVVKASGVFSEVSEDPVANGAILNVIIDNVVDPAEARAAMGQGAATGATLGIAGSTIREHYTSNIEFMAGPDAPKISRNATHFLLVQMGLIHNGAPENAVKVDGGIKGGVAVMTRQIVSNPLNAIASDPAFASPASPAPAAASPAPAASSPAPTPT